MAHTIISIIRRAIWVVGKKSNRRRESPYYRKSFWLRGFKISDKAIYEWIEQKRTYRMPRETSERIFKENGLRNIAKPHPNVSLWEWLSPKVWLKDVLWHLGTNVCAWKGRKNTYIQCSPYWRVKSVTCCSWWLIKRMLSNCDNCHRWRNDWKRAYWPFSCIWRSDVVLWQVLCVARKFILAMPRFTSFCTPEGDHLHSW